ncbi:MAG: hypothetical protein C0623_08020 [Desulfuromonas sp.]|nr:MAG: hypothetical protein C0623_08020 [Desulfuromonas sp.]
MTEKTEQHCAAIGSEQPVWKRFFVRLGHFQALLVLFLLFWLVLTPYAVILKWCGFRFLPKSVWHKADNKMDLQSLRRIF